MSVYCTRKAQKHCRGRPINLRHENPQKPVPPLFCIACCNAGQLPPLPPGSVPSFAQLHQAAPQAAAAAGGAVGDEAEFLQQLAAASGGEEQQQELLQPAQQQQRRSWADGDSSDEEEALDTLATLRRQSNAGAGCGSAVGGVGKPGSRRGTAVNAPAVTTAEEARKASRAGKKLPSTKLQDLLAHSDEPLAVFLRETYDVTANFVSDEVDLEVMQRQFKRWQRARAGAAAAPGLSTAGGAAAAAAGLSRAGAAAAALSGAGGLAGPEASAAALQGPRLAASLAGAGLLAAEASSLGLQAAAAAAAAGQPPAAAAAGAAKRPLSGEEVAAFGFKFVQQPEHTMFGVLVDQQVGGWLQQQPVLVHQRQTEQLLQQQQCCTECCCSSCSVHLLMDSTARDLAPGMCMNLATMGLDYCGALIWHLWPFCE